MFHLGLERPIYRLMVALGGAVLLLALTWTLLPTAPALAPPGPWDATVVPAQTPTPTICPVATPVPLWVDPVPAYTNRLTETVVVYIGYGEAVTVTCESGVYGVQGDFDIHAHPARVEVALSPLTTHHLEVEAQVKLVEQWGCLYGGYTLRATTDLHGSPLVIRQIGESGSVRYLPLVLK